MRSSPREKGKTAFSKEKPSKKAISPFSPGKNRISQGVENRGSLISVPLALRVVAISGRVEAAGDAATQIASDLRPRVEGH